MNPSTISDRVDSLVDFAEACGKLGQPSHADLADRILGNAARLVPSSAASQPASNNRPALLEINRPTTGDADSLYAQVFALDKVGAQVTIGLGMLLWIHDDDNIGTIRHPLVTWACDIELDTTPATATPGTLRLYAAACPKLPTALLAALAPAVVAPAKQWLDTNRDALTTNPAGIRDLARSMAHALAPDGKFAMTDDTAMPEPTRQLVVTDQVWLFKTESRGAMGAWKDTEQVAPPLGAMVGDTPSVPAEHDQLSPTRVPCWVSAVSPALTLISAALVSGRSCVLRGGPGTGKTQNAANVICERVVDGDSIYVVAKTSAAIDAIKTKLPSVLQETAVDLSHDVDTAANIQGALMRIAKGIDGADLVDLDERRARLALELSSTLAQVEKIDAELSQAPQAQAQRVRAAGYATELAAARNLYAGHANVCGVIAAVDSGRQFGPADIDRLRNARATVGADIEQALLQCVSAAPPDIAGTIPEMLALQQAVEAHSKHSVAPAGPAPEQELLQTASQSMLDLRDAIQALSERVGSVGADALLEVRRRAAETLVPRFGTLEAELVDKLDDPRDAALATVEAPPSNPRLHAAVVRRAKGKIALTKIGDLFTPESLRNDLDAIRIGGAAVGNPRGWRMVLAYFEREKQLQQLVERYNAIAEEIGLDALPIGSDSARRALDAVCAVALADQVLASEQRSSQALVACGLPAAGKNAGAMLADFFTRLDLRNRAASVKLRLGNQPTTNAMIDEILDGKIDTATLTLRCHALRDQAQRDAAAQVILDVTRKIQASGAHEWSQKLRTNPAGTDGMDALLPTDWESNWDRRAVCTIAPTSCNQLLAERGRLISDIARLQLERLEVMAWTHLKRRVTADVLAAMGAYQAAIRKLGKGSGPAAPRYRKAAGDAASMAMRGVSLWLATTDRIADLPNEPVDLLVVEEASQIALPEILPLLMRCRRLLVIGDECQTGVKGAFGISEEQITALQRMLDDNIPYKNLFAPGYAIFDICRVAFAASTANLETHYRGAKEGLAFCNEHIYGNHLKVLTPPRSMRPPLSDIYVQDGLRRGKTNAGEAHAVVAELAKLIKEQATLTVGVVSLFGAEQAMSIARLARREFGAAALERMDFLAGDIKSFQGQERDIIFLTMVVSPGQASAAAALEQGSMYNVATSRARQTTVLVRSVHTYDLSDNDLWRLRLLAHFETKHERAGQATSSCPEIEALGQALKTQGAGVRYAVPVGNSTADLLIDGTLAVFVDGQEPHKPEQWRATIAEHVQLQQAGWQIVRVNATELVFHPDVVLQALLQRSRAIDALAERPLTDAPSQAHIRIAA